MLLGFAVVTATPLEGCLPIAVPPARVGVGGGAELRANRTAPAEGVTGAPVGEVRGSVNPLGLFAETHRRPIDVGLGYGFESAGTGNSIHGPFLMLETFVLQTPSTPASFRIGAVSMLGLAFTDLDGEKRQGARGSFGLDFERTGWRRGAAGGNGVAAAVMGEWSLGGYVAAGYAGLDGLRAYSLVAGLEVRLPGTLALLCCSL